MSCSTPWLFSGVAALPRSSSSSISSSHCRPDYRRTSTSSNTSHYSRESWCSTVGSDVSSSSTTQCHVSHDQDSIDELVLASFADNAIFGSTSPRKSKSTGMRSSIESARSYASSSSSVRSPRTPITPLFSHPEHNATTIPVRSSVTLPMVAEIPKLKRPHLSRIVFEEVQYIGRSLDVPVSEEAHQERFNSVQRSASTAPCCFSPSSSRFSTWNGKDGLMIAMDELEQELVRTMNTLSASANTTPVSTISKARGKSMRRPHTADKAATPSSSRSLLKGLSHTAATKCIPNASQTQSQRESWMPSKYPNADEGILSYSGRPIRFSASDLTLPSDYTDLVRRSDVRPISQESNVSKRSSRSDSNSPTTAALVFKGRSSGSSTSSFGNADFQQASSRPDSFVTAKDHDIVSANAVSLNKRPSTVRSPPIISAFYQLQKGPRSTPSLASSEPPRDPLPPLPSLPAGLSHLLNGAAVPPPRPAKSSARNSTSSLRNSPVPSPHKPLRTMPC